VSSSLFFFCFLTVNSPVHCAICVSILLPTPLAHAPR
jgi:hypothetical protein